MSIKGLLFDFDGTLADSTGLIMAAFHHSCQEVLGHDVPDKAIYDTFGLILPEAMEQLADSPEQVDALRASYRKFNNEHHDAMIKPMPGAVEAVAALAQRGIKMALVTSKKNPMAHRGLRCCGMDAFISTVVAYGDTQYTKPHPQPMQAAAQLLGLIPQDCLAVGDSPFDLISGRAAGAKTAAVRFTNVEWEQMLKVGKPDYVLNTLTELVQLVDELNADSFAQEGGNNNA